MSLRLIATGIAALAMLAGDAEAKGIEGTYEITKSEFFRNGSHTGTVTIARTGKTFALDWKTSKGSHTGVGFLQGGWLWAAAGTGNCQLFLLKRARNGALSGRWTHEKAGGRFGSEKVSPSGDFSGVRPNGTRYSGSMSVTFAGSFGKLTKGNPDDVSRTVKGRSEEGGVAERGKTYVGIAIGCDLRAYRVKGKRLIGEISNTDQDNQSGKNDRETLKRTGPLPKVPTAAAQIYRAGGHAISIPSGWSRSGKGKFKSPATRGYPDNMQVIVTKPFAITKKNAKALIKVFVSQLKKSFGDYRMKSAKLRKFGRFTALHIVGAVKIKGHKVVIDNAILAAPRVGLMLGCNYDAKRKRATSKLCHATFKSVR